MKLLCTLDFNDTHIHVINMQMFHYSEHKSFCNHSTTDLFTVDHSLSLSLPLFYSQYVFHLFQSSFLPWVFCLAGLAVCLWIAWLGDASDRVMTSLSPGLPGSARGQGTSYRERVREMSFKVKTIIRTYSTSQHLVSALPLRPNV